jgi:ABC-type uncharacterized transport system permease subunit
VYLATYARYWRINLLTMLEYRANFIMWAIFTVIYHATAIVALWVTLRNFPSIPRYARILRTYRSVAGLSAAG